MPDGFRSRMPQKRETRTKRREYANTGREHSLFQVAPSWEAFFRGPSGRTSPSRRSPLRQQVRCPARTSGGRCPLASDQAGWRALDPGPNSQLWRGISNLRHRVRRIAAPTFKVLVSVARPVPRNSRTPRPGSRRVTISWRPGWAALPRFERSAKLVSSRAHALPSNPRWANACAGNPRRRPDDHRPSASIWTWNRIGRVHAYKRCGSRAARGVQPVSMGEKARWQCCGPWL